MKTTNLGHWRDQNEVLVIYLFIYLLSIRRIELHSILTIKA
jgi:hypothetical protein